MRSADAGSGFTRTAIGRPFCHSRKACAFSGPPEPGTATTTPRWDRSTGRVPTTRTPRLAVWLAEGSAAAGMAVADAAVAATATATTVTLSSRPRTRRLRCVPETVSLLYIADLDHGKTARPCVGSIAGTSASRVASWVGCDCCDTPEATVIAPLRGDRRKEESGDPGNGIPPRTLAGRSRPPPR